MPGSVGEGESRVLESLSELELEPLDDDDDEDELELAEAERIRALGGAAAAAWGCLVAAHSGQPYLAPPVGTGLWAKESFDPMRA